MEIYVKLEETAFLFKCLLCMDLEGYKHLDKDSNDLPRQDLPGMMKSLKSSYKT